MDVLRLKQEHGDYEVTLRSDNIEYAWEKFRGRINSTQISQEDPSLPRAEHYCHYESKDRCHLWLYQYGDIDCACPEESRTDWSEMWPVVFETCNYNIAIRFKDGVTNPKVCHIRKDVENAFYQDTNFEGKIIGVSGNVSFLNEPGLFKLEFEYQLEGKQHVSWLTFDVVSPKLDTKHDYKRLLHDVNEEYNDVIFRYLATTYQQLARGRVRNDVVWMNLFESIVEDYLKNIETIIRCPHQRVKANLKVAKAEQIKHWTPQMEDEYEEQRIAKQIETHYFEYKDNETTVNTRENRFVKHTLTTIGKRLTHILDEVIGRDRNDELSESHLHDLEAYKRRIEKLVKHPFFRTVGKFEGINGESLVLQSRTGYQQIYKDWIKLRRGIDLYNGASNIGTLQIWEIYELWCFIKMKRMIRQLLHIDGNPYYEHLVSEPKGSLLNPFTNSTMEHVVKFEYPEPKKEDISEWALKMRHHKGDVITLHYQHTFNRRNADDFGIHTATTEQRPDIVLNIEKKDGSKILLTYLYDAKYRVVSDKRLDKDIEESDLAEMQELRGGDYPPADAINQMHRYRDAIYYGSDKKDSFSKEIIGGYILFPGRGDDTTIKKRYYSNSVESVNIGAFPLLPCAKKHGDGASHEEDDSPYLYDHLKDILLVKNITTEHVRRAIPQRGLFYTDTKPKDVESKNVLTALVRKNDLEYNDFFEHKAKKYIMEKMPKVNILEATYLLPMVGGHIDGYYKLKGLAIDDGKMCFKLGEFTSIGSEWKYIYRIKMQPGELITMNNVLKLYKD